MSRLGRIGMTWNWRLVKDIIMERALIRRAMNSCILIWKAGLYRDVDHHSGRHLNNELEILHYRSRGNQRPPLAMLQVYD